MYVTCLIMFNDLNLKCTALRFLLYSPTGTLEAGDTQKKDRDLLGKVQKRVMRMIRGLLYLPYEEG